MLENDNRKLIYQVLKKYNLYSKREDYYDIGLIGLTKAINTYNKNKGIKFSTYAYICIENEIKHELRKESGAKRKSNYKTISLNQKIKEYGNNELEDILESNINIEKDYEYKETVEELYNNINKLNQEDKKIICIYYGINCEKYNQEKLAKILKISQAQVSRRIKKILKELKGYYENNN